MEQSNDELGDSLYNNADLHKLEAKIGMLERINKLESKISYLEKIIEGLKEGRVMKGTYNQLEACPFCGCSHPILSIPKMGSKRKTSRIKCPKCGVFIKSDTIEGLVSRWNTRASGGILKVQLHNLQEQLDTARADNSALQKEYDSLRTVRYSL